MESGLTYLSCGNGYVVSVFFLSSTSSIKLVSLVIYFFTVHNYGEMIAAAFVSNAILALFKFLQLLRLQAILAIGK